ncbi:Ppx/GppA phosphatase family protein [Kocuria rosea]|jgi:exopolyphosphatase/guanosine-5'-triphosphate,3'-diphosphate pyrophosphatase|uniref:Ppx/GppA phosphatase family protein n=1 Tax=Kocuria rosea TaxID=1275 RepID=UPI00203FE19A|nr:Ppx/GppA family phosphatase [Kocuria rosea]MCM3688740.1 Ppx/GppA family phosphatase [Kocuria rosea]
MRLGVLDVGSNTVHLLLLDVYPGARPEPYASHKMPLQLVQHQDAQGNITGTGRDALTDFVLEARDFAVRHDAEDLLAFATSAIREAGNGAEVLDHVQARSGVTLTELAGDQEAAVTFFAVRRWFGWGAGTVLDLDIGGGSFEMALGDNALPSVAVSVPLGAGRLTRSFVAGELPTPKEMKALRKHVRAELRPAVEKVRAAGRPTVVAGTSKTFRSLARICGAAPYAMGPYVRRTLHVEDLRLWSRRMEAMTVQERAELPGVSPARARQILAGAVVAEAAMDAYGVESLQICPWALREGLILRRLDQLTGNADVRTVDPRHLVGAA